MSGNRVPRRGGWSTQETELLRGLLDDARRPVLAAGKQFTLGIDLTVALMNGMRDSHVGRASGRQYTRQSIQGQIRDNRDYYYGELNSRPGLTLRSANGSVGPSQAPVPAPASHYNAVPQGHGPQSNAYYNSTSYSAAASGPVRHSRSPSSGVRYNPPDNHSYGSMGHYTAGNPQAGGSRHSSPGHSQNQGSRGAPSTQHGQSQGNTGGRRPWEL